MMYSVIRQKIKSEIKKDYPNWADKFINEIVDLYSPWKLNTSGDVFFNLVAKYYKRNQGVRHVK